MEKLIGTITEMKRLPNSEDGNPTWSFRLRFDAGPDTRRVKTAKNSACGYVLSPNSEGSRAVVTMAGYRTVSEIDLLPPVGVLVD